MAKPHRAARPGDLARMSISEAGPVAQSSTPRTTDDGRLTWIEKRVYHFFSRELQALVLPPVHGTRFDERLTIR
jgi:hypothetical protein